MALTLLLLPVSCSIFFWLLWKILHLGRRSATLPPGPPTAPIVGNLHLMPKGYLHHRFTEWAQVYGDIYTLMMGPGVVIVVNSAEVCKEFMDKRSSTTADRPVDSIIDTITDGFNMILAHYSDTWRTMRKATHSILNQKASETFLPIQQAESMQLLHDILETPDRTWYHVRRYSNSVILSVLYGKRSPTYATTTTAAFFHVQHKWEALLAAGAHPPVDMIPALKLVPARWAPWKRATREVRTLQRALYLGLLQECETRVARPESAGSAAFVDELVLQREELGMSREAAAYLGGSLIEGGTDTTAAYLQSFLLALAAYPDVQQKLYAEMNTAVGSQRMPTLEDFDDLPYLQAVVKETHRWRPSVPIIPHSPTVDEIYKGYIIPKGCTILVNLWGALHDPVLYDDPEAFDPERYIRSEFGTKPGVDTSALRHTLHFGVGRRICPGMHVADNTITINTMNLIWGFEFHPPKDKVMDVCAYFDGVLSAPEPYALSIRPRSDDHAQMIERAFSDVIPVYAPYEETLSSEDRRLLAHSRGGA